MTFTTTLSKEAHIQQMRDGMQTMMKNADKVGVSYLYERWLDEREYEDFADYAKKMEEWVKDMEGYTFVKATKRPFGFQFKMPTIAGEVVFHLTFNTRGMTVKVV